MNAHTLPCSGLLAFVFASCLPAQSDYDLFVTAFSQAIKFNSVDGISKAIRGRPEEAIRHFEALLISAKRADDEDSYKDKLDQLRSGFVKAFECKTLDHVERYYQRVDVDRINSLYKTDSQYQSLYTQWLKAKTSRDRKGILELIEHGLRLGRYVEELGHKLKAAKVYGLMATCLTTIPGHTLQDTKDTIEYVKMFMVQRKSWEWTKDTMYTQWKNWVASKEITIKETAKKTEERKKDGLDTSAEGLGGFVDKKITPLVGKLEFKPLKTLPDARCFMGGPVPVNWMSVYIGKGPAKLAWFKKRSVYLFRTGANKIEFALTDREDAKKMKVEAGAKVKPSIVYLEPGKKDPYCIGFFIGSSQESFAGTAMNVAPTDEALTVYYRSMSSWVTKIDGHEITFFDDNCDGKLFTEDPTAYGFKTRLTGMGPKDEQDVDVYDSFRIGKRGPLMPYSSAIKLGDRWWLLSSADKGKAVEAKALHPNHFHTGTVEMKWSGTRNAKPQFLIIRGKDEVASTAFNIVSKKPVEVPVGVYYISYGRAMKGKGAQAMIAHIFRGDSEVIKVEKGKNTVVKLGGPFKFDFKKGGDDTNIELDSLFFRIKGIGGEVYAKLQGPTPAPRVFAARSSSGKGAKEMGAYVGISSPEMLQTAGDTLRELLKKQNLRDMGSNVAYFPIVKGDKTGSTVLKFKVPFTGALIGLRMKKHKMFGKIGSLEFK